MTSREYRHATQILAAYADRFDKGCVYAGVYAGDLTLTAHWRTGGQRLFHDLEEVEDWAEEINQWAWQQAVNTQNHTGQVAEWDMLTPGEREDFRNGVVRV